jgi:phosphoglucosamine mutase
MTCETVLRLGQAVAQVCKQETGGRHRVVIGKDTRRSGDMLESALTAGICSMGVEVLLAGVLPTPAIAFLTRDLGASTGAVISASHNSFEDNGIKLFAHTGFKLPDAAEHEIEQFVAREGPPDAPVAPSALGKTDRLADAAERYKAFVKGTLPRGLTLAGLRVVIDAAHGAAYRVAPEVFEALGAEVVAVGVTPDGENINRGCGAVHPEQLRQTVVTQRAQLGVALDGDADRVILVDERGDVVDGDEALAMVAAEMLAHGTLKHATVVATVMSNIGLEVALRERGASLVRVQVGDRYVVEAMRGNGCNLGGEQSGHLIFLDHSTTGDGIIAGLRVARLMIERRRPLSELKRVMTKFPQVLVNVPVKQRRDLSTIAPLQECVARITAALHDRGRVVIRFSGTEPLVRVMVEGEHGDRVSAYAEEIAAVIRAQLGT